jgi:PmbA protein
LSDLHALAQDVLRRAREAGADAADVIAASGTHFTVTVRKGEVETLKQATTRSLGLRVFVGRRTALTRTSDFSAEALERQARDAVDMARASGEDPAAGLPDETPPPDDVELDLFDPSPGALPPDERIALARRAEAAALAFSPEITNSNGATYDDDDDTLVLANTQGFAGGYRRSTVSLSVSPLAERAGAKERDSWYSNGRGLGDLAAPEEIGRIAAERTLRRLGARKIATCEVPVVFDPETATDLLDDVFSALSGYAVFRNATFLKDRLGQAVASPLVTVIDDGRRRRGLGSRPFDGEGLRTRRNVPIESGVLRSYLCDTYAARKLGTRANGCARRAVGSAPTVGASNLWLEAGTTPAAQILASTARGLYVTDLIGFGVDLVSGDYSRGAVGHWIENGRLAHPVHEVTIAGNLADMLRDIDAVGSDLEFRGSVSAPTLRVRRMTVSGS